MAAVRLREKDLLLSHHRKHEVLMITEAITTGPTTTVEMEADITAIGTGVMKAISLSDGGMTTTVTVVPKSTSALSTVVAVKSSGEKNQQSPMVAVIVIVQMMMTVAVTAVVVEARNMDRILGMTTMAMATKMKMMMKKKDRIIVERDPRVVEDAGVEISVVVGSMTADEEGSEVVEEETGEAISATTIEVVQMEMITTNKADVVLERTGMERHLKKVVTGTVAGHHEDVDVAAVVVAEDRMMMIGTEMTCLRDNDPVV